MPRSRRTSRAARSRRASRAARSRRTRASPVGRRRYGSLYNDVSTFQTYYENFTTPGGRWRPEDDDVGIFETDTVLQGIMRFYKFWNAEAYLPHIKQILNTVHDKQKNWATHMYTPGSIIYELKNSYDGNIDAFAAELVSRIKTLMKSQRSTTYNVIKSDMFEHQVVKNHVGLYEFWVEDMIWTFENIFVKPKEVPEYHNIQVDIHPEKQKISLLGDYREKEYSLSFLNAADEPVASGPIKFRISSDKGFLQIRTIGTPRIVDEEVKKDLIAKLKLETTMATA
jgi:hypothetical protein